MGLTALARDRLRMEGLGAIDHFSEFKVEELKMAIKNIKQPIPGDATADPPVAPIAAVYLSAKCFHRLKVASHAYHYYMDIGRAPTPANMNYSSVLKGFYIEWEAVQKLIDEDKPSVPVLNPQERNNSTKVVGVIQGLLIPYLWSPRVPLVVCLSW